MAWELVKVLIVLYIDTVLVNWLKIYAHNIQNVSINPNNSTSAINLLIHYIIPNVYMLLVLIYFYRKIYVKDIALFNMMKLISFVAIPFYYFVVCSVWSEIDTPFL